ncbi:hypothetical protein [Prescottella equi]|uniref:hypothetical protein n=1 Tax=Rhodococcus hoagii TaxID=43767 RepID=UPI000A0FBFB6|nr:hypothetical protein [Prescottella equi]NKS42321.1 hypothetical protein [Prescottella equi]NKS42538.1 hypothetical protein [Prescottella equi]ORM21757.1 hypothetical protein A5N74_02840 [Prescottella equi]
MGNRTLATLGVAAAATALIAGCGSDEDDQAAAAEASCIEAVTKDYNPDGLSFRDTTTVLRNDGYFTASTVEGRYSSNEDADVRAVTCLTPASGVAEVLGYGYEGEEAPDHKLTPREQACRTIKVLTPGTLETTWDLEVLADPNSTQSQRFEALKRQAVAQGSGTPVRSAPYTCSGPTFEKFLEEQGS